MAIEQVLRNYIHYHVEMGLISLLSALGLGESTIRYNYTLFLYCILWFSGQCYYLSGLTEDAPETSFTTKTKLINLRMLDVTHSPASDE